MPQGSESGSNTTTRSARVRRTFSLGEPVVPILILAGIFDALSGNGIHSVLLFAAAAVLLREAWVGPKERPEGTDFGSSVPPTWILVLVGLLYAVLIGEFGRYSWPATVAVLAPASLGLVLAWRATAPSVEPPALTRVGVAAWAGVFVAIALWELTQLFLQPSLTTDSYAHPTISVMTDPVLASHVGRSIMLFGWLAVGWWLVRATVDE